MSYPIEKLFDSKYIKVFDLQTAPGSHYFDATRRKAENLVAVKSKEAFQNMLPDAVSCCVILEEDDQKHILLTREYRYPLGQYVISIPAGLIDEKEETGTRDQLILATAQREMQEETGITLTAQDKISILNPCLFSSPGFTDECNALVKIKLKNHSRTELSQTGAVDGEKFDGFLFADEAEATRIMREERISTYAWMALAAFLADKT